jgi:hypothetical protein
MNDYLAHRLVTDRQAAINASIQHGALAREAMTTRASRPAWTFRPSLTFRVARAVGSGLVRFAHPAL